MGEVIGKVEVERRGHVLLMGLDRPAKANAFDVAMLTALADAYTELGRDPELRVGLLYSKAKLFTGGIDLPQLGPKMADGTLNGLYDGRIDPTGMATPRVEKPVVFAVKGTCLTIGIEIILAGDICIAAEDATFAQIEPARGIMATGGASVRMQSAFGWGNAMRWLLTGDSFDAREAHRIGLVQEVVPVGQEFDRALAIAERIAAQAPLAVQAQLKSSIIARRESEAAAIARTGEMAAPLLRSEDARRGLEAFLSRQPATFVGR